MNVREPLVRVSRLSKTFTGGVDPQGTPIRVQALKDVSFDIHPGEFVAVVGVNGSGKSTLIHCLGSFEAPDPVPGQSAGPIQCYRDGQPLDIQNEVDWYRQNFVGIVFQAFHLLPQIRVWQNVEIPLKLGHCERFTVDSGERRERVREVLERLDLAHHFHSRVHQTSGGQRQRVAIARALVKRPALLLADEPTGNLDESNKRNLVEILAGLAREGVAVLMVTHDHRYVDEHADRIITLEDGEIKSIETRRSPAGPTTSSAEVAVAAESSGTEVNAVETQAAAAPENPDTSSSGNGDAGGSPAAASSRDADAATVGPTSDEAGDARTGAIAPANGAARTRGGSPLASVWNSCKRVRIPLCDQRVYDLTSYALRDARESTVALLSNVVAILCGTVLTTLLMALLVGTGRYVRHAVEAIPNIDAVHTWVDYSTGAEPLTAAEFDELTRYPGASTVLPNIQQFTSLYRIESRDTIVTLASGGVKDPETSRLDLLKGSLDLAPQGWSIVINERVANELDNFNPLGLVGKKITLQLRRYEKSDSPEAAQVSKTLRFPVQVVGIVRNSYKDRVYGSLDMVRFIRDFSTGRSEYAPEPEGPIDVAQISPRTMYEGVRMHFADPWQAEQAYQVMKEKRGGKLDLFWAGSELEYLRDVQTVAFLVFLGIGLLTILAGSISVFNTLRASVAHKTSEIGILRALGVTRVDIFFIYIFQSLIVGVLAGAVGLLLAWFFASRLNALVGRHWEQLQKSMSATGGLFVIPPEVALVVFGVVCLICVLAASFPAMWAARRTPMDALNQPGR